MIIIICLLNTYIFICFLIQTHLLCSFLWIQAAIYQLTCVKGYGVANISMPRTVFPLLIHIQSSCAVSLWILVLLNISGQYIFRGQAAHGWKRAIVPLAVLPLVWMSSERMSPWVSLHRKQWAAKQRDSSLWTLLNRIFLSHGLIELGSPHTHTQTHTNTRTHTHAHTHRGAYVTQNFTAGVMRTCWEDCGAGWGPRGLMER